MPKFIDMLDKVHSYIYDGPNKWRSILVAIVCIRALFGTSLPVHEFQELTLMAVGFLYIGAVLRGRRGD